MKWKRIERLLITSLAVMITFAPLAFASDLFWSRMAAKWLLGVGLGLPCVALVIAAWSAAVESWRGDA